MGLIAGLGYTEMKHMLPGEIMDFYAWQMKYDTSVATMKLKGII